MTKDRDEDADEKTPAQEGSRAADTETAEAAEEAEPASGDATVEDEQREEAAEDEDAKPAAKDDDDRDEAEDAAEDESEDAADDESDEEAEDDANDDDADDDERDEKVAAKPRDDGGRAEPAQDRTRLMMLGAVLVGLIVVAVAAWSNDGESGQDEEIADTAGQARSAPEKAPDDPLSQLAQQQRGPEPVPAPPDVATPPEGAERSESGLAWRVVEAGTGSDHPSEGDLVTIHYTAWTSDGRMVDSSVPRGEPAIVPLARAVPAWREGVPSMVVGEKRRFWAPPELADTGRGPPPGPITFDVELLRFEPAPEPPEAPRDVSRPPRNAERTESGLAYRILQEGTGEEHPSPQSRVRAHFSSWNTDGELLDTSIPTGEPALLPSLQRLLPGMREGIQMMVVGEKRRLWIPEELAFAGRPGGPEGMLVFDIELVEILEPPPGVPGMPGMPGAPGMRGLPPGHPPAGGMPPGHPPAGQMPPGHPPAGQMPPGHPPG